MNKNNSYETGEITDQSFDDHKIKNVREYMICIYSNQKYLKNDSFNLLLTHSHCIRWKSIAFKR